MSKLSRIGNAGQEAPKIPGLKTKMVAKVINLGKKDILDISEGEMDLLIARERIKAERDAVAKLRGIGSLKTQKYQDSLDTIEDALAEISGDNNIEHMACIDQHISEGRYSNARYLNGIGDVKSIAQRRNEFALGRKQERDALIGDIGKRKKLKEIVKNIKTKTGKFIKKAAEKVRKGLKAVVKVATFPERLAAKAILEVTLPQSAPFFLYLFINDPALIAKMPEKARRKRKKAEKFADFIVNTIGMKRNHFMGIVRTGIVKHFGKSPESVIADQIAGKKIHGIGDIYSAGFGALVTIITKLVSIFKKKKPDEEVTADDSPSADDFEGMDSSASTKLASDVKKQSDNQNFDKDTTDSGGGKDGEDDHNGSGGRKVWKSF